MSNRKAHKSKKNQAIKKGKSRMRMPRSSNLHQMTKLPAVKEKKKISKQLKLRPLRLVKKSKKMQSAKA